MQRSLYRKWFYLVATGSFLFQATVGCPNEAMLRGVGSSSLQALINGVLGLYVKSAANQLFGV